MSIHIVVHLFHDQIASELDQKYTNITLYFNGTGSSNAVFV